MTASFYEAAQRHWADGLLLERERRLPNADQLFGFAAECAIKRALSVLSGSANDEELVGRYRKHVDELWERAQLQGMQKRFPGLLAILKTSNPFENWSVDQRYGVAGTLTEAVLQAHKVAARRLLGAVGITGTRRGER